MPDKPDQQPKDQQPNKEQQRKADEQQQIVKEPGYMPPVTKE